MFSGQDVKVLPTFEGLTLSLKRVAGGLVEPIHQQHPKDGDGISPWKVSKPSSTDDAVCPRTFHWILSPRKASNLVQIYLFICNFKALLDVKCFMLWMYHFLYVFCTLQQLKRDFVKRTGSGSVTRRRDRYCTDVYTVCAYIDVVNKTRNRQR